MILSTKQLEELESLQEMVEDLSEEQGELEESDEGAEGALAWRRGMIEKALSFVRKVMQQPDPSEESQPKGSLVFDVNTKRFGRVIGSGNGPKQKIAFLASEKLSASSKSIKGMKSPEKPATQPTKKAQVEKKEVKKPVSKPKEKPSDKKMPSSSPHPKTKKALESKSTPAKKQKSPLTAAKGLKLSQKIPVKKETSKSQPSPSLKKKKDHLADPNKYIQKNYQSMSNKELANATGLSEHTIRRKLGEWGLKRASRSSTLQTPKKAPHPKA